jgi:ferredoxin
MTSIVEVVAESKIEKLTINCHARSKCGSCPIAISNLIARVALPRNEQRYYRISSYG